MNGRGRNAQVVSELKIPTKVDGLRDSALSFEGSLLRGSCGQLGVLQAFSDEPGSGHSEVLRGVGQSGCGKGHMVSARQPVL